MCFVYCQRWLPPAPCAGLDRLDGKCSNIVFNNSLYVTTQDACDYRRRCNVTDTARRPVLCVYFVLASAPSDIFACKFNKISMYEVCMC